MTLRFPHIRQFFCLCIFLSAAALSSCASTPPPTTELDAARQAVTRADNADAQQYASTNYARARSLLTQAQTAMSGKKLEDARLLALQASAEADLAYAKSRQAVTDSELVQRQQDVDELKQRLNFGDQ